MISADVIASMIATITNSLDVALPISRKTTVPDGQGGSVSSWVTKGSPMVNIAKPTFVQLQAYASLIGSKRALMIRYMPTSDIREGDRASYSGLNWLIQSVLNAESYSYANDAVMTVIV